MENEIQLIHWKVLESFRYLSFSHFHVANFSSSSLSIFSHTHILLKMIISNSNPSIHSNTTEWKPCKRKKKLSFMKIHSLMIFFVHRVSLARSFIFLLIFNITSSSYQIRNPNYICNFLTYKIIYFHKMINLWHLKLKTIEHFWIFNFLYYISVIRLNQTQHKSLHFSFPAKINSDCFENNFFLNDLHECCEIYLILNTEGFMAWYYNNFRKR